MSSGKGKASASKAPKLNKYMHPRNPYRTPPSFKKLAKTYPEFRPFCCYDVSGKVHLDFKDPRAVRALTTCLMDQDFGLKVTIPDDCLVPTLPLRLNYLLWVEDLLLHAAHCNASDSVTGVDIGTGASCVYPLLAARKLGWKMLATETDATNFTAANTNVLNNNLQEAIIVKKVEETTLFKGVLDNAEIQKQMYLKKMEVREDDSNEVPKSEPGTPDEQVTCSEKVKYIFDFTMCNPPFFSSEEEIDTMKKSRKQRGEPVSKPTGSVHEKVTVGGEVGFITQMVEESIVFRGKVRIFTSLIGSKSHVKEIKNIVLSSQPTSLVMTEFCQGRTMRWGVAWTFESNLDLCQVKSKKDMLTNKPLVLNIPRSLVSVYNIPAIWSLINKWLHQLKLKVRILKKNPYFVSVNVKAFQATWLHVRRRKRQDKRKEEMEERKGEEETERQGGDKTEERQGGEEMEKREREEEMEEEKGEEESEERQSSLTVKGEEVSSQNVHLSNGKCPKRKLEEGNECQELLKTEDKKIKLQESVDRKCNDKPIMLDNELRSYKKKSEIIKPEAVDKPDSFVLGDVIGSRQETLPDIETSKPQTDLTKQSQAVVDHSSANASTVENVLTCKAACEFSLLVSQESKDQLQHCHCSNNPSSDTNTTHKSAVNKAEWILRCNIQVKQTGRLIFIEAFYLDGSGGKDALNQILQFMRNQLTSRVVP